MRNPTKTLRLLVTGFAATAIAAGAAACGGGQAAVETAAQPETPVEPPKEDITLDGFEEVKIQGALFVPEGLGTPGMARLRSGQNVPLNRKRRNYQRARGDKKVDEGKSLVSTLWEQARVTGATDDAAAEGLRQEALTILRELKGMEGGADAIVLQMLFAAESRMENKDEAMAAGQELVERFGDSSVARAMAPYVAYNYLNAWKTAEAAALTQTWDLSAQGTSYTHAYVAGWVALRQRDWDKARAAISQAARGWRSATTRPIVERDVALFMARTDAPVEDATMMVTELSRGDKTSEYFLLYELHKAYATVGAFEKASSVLERAIEVAGADMPPADLVSFRSSQFNYSVLEYRAGTAAEQVIATYKALEPCGEKCAGQIDTVADQVSKLATYWHNIYTATLDDRYYGPAKQLYEFYLTLNRSDAETLRTYLTRLEETKKLAAQVKGKHTKEIMDRATSVSRASVVQGCYESVLQGNPELAGTMQVSLDIDSSGTVTEVTTEPAAGAEGMGMVATCVQEAARTWMFPGRSSLGNTRVSRSFALETSVPVAATTPVDATAGQ